MAFAVLSQHESSHLIRLWTSSCCWFVMLYQRMLMTADSLDIMACLLVYM